MLYKLGLTITILDEYFYIYTFALYSLLDIFLMEKTFINNFNNLRRLDFHKNKQKILLEYLLPQHVEIIFKQKLN